jgi:hypothetical protein
MTIEQLTALVDRLVDDGDGVRAVRTALAQLRHLASQADLASERYRRETKYADELRAGVQRIRVYAARQAAHYERKGFGEARAWRHVEHAGHRTITAADALRDGGEG